MRNVKRIGWCLVACAWFARGALAETPPTGMLPDDAEPLAYTLELKIDPRADNFSGHVRIHVKLRKALDHLWLHASAIVVERIELIDAEGRPHAATLTVRDPTGTAEVALDSRLSPQEVDLSIQYHAPFNAKLQGLYKVKVGDDAYAVTQMEPTSARYAFPSFDEPRFKTPFDVLLTVPKDTVAIANTRPTAERAADDPQWKTLTFAKTKPLPTYLVAIAVGPWDVVEGPAIAADAVRREPLALRGIGPRGSGPQFHWILDETPKIVRYFEEYTGQPYPFDKLDLLGAPDFGAGAMENAGLVIFRDVLLRLDANSSATAHRAGFNVTAHELAHQWFGDLVTVPWWNDIWLNEAFATWAQGKATVDLMPDYHGDLARLEGTLRAMRSDSLLSARKIRQPIKSNDDIQTAFDGITYQKGAAVLRMFEEWLGETTYRAAMRDYLAAHAYGSGSSDDLVATLARVSGRGASLTAAFGSFLDQPGIPLVKTALRCVHGKARLAMTQSRYLPYGVAADPAQWRLPVCVRFIGGAKPATQCFVLDRPRREFAVSGSCPVAYLPNAGAHGYYRFALSDGDFAALRRQAGRLTAVEQMIYADAISSSFERGALTLGAVLDAMPALSRSDLPEVATSLNAEFAWIRDHLAADPTRAALDGYGTALFAPAVARLGLQKRPDDSDRATNLRVRLVNFLAFTVRDPVLLQRLNQQGRVALGMESGAGTGASVDLSRIDADTRAASLKAAVQLSGEPAFRAILGELAVNHQTQQRYDLLAALGSSHDARLGEEVRNDGLTPAVAVGEISLLYSSQVGEEENRAAFWQWLQSHYEALAGRLPDQFQNTLIRIAATKRCSAPEAAELRAFFTPRLPSIIGGERALAQSLESIDQCAALREHVTGQALETWAAAHPVTHH